MVRRTVALIASVLVVSAANSVEETCDANDPDCDLADVSLAQLRLRAHTAKTNSSVATNQTFPNLFGDDGPPRNAECFAISLGQCDGGPPPSPGMPERGCERNQGCFRGRCACRNGCAGDDGGCYEQGNKLLLSKFSLRNAMRTNRYMYMKKLTTNNQINTVSNRWSWSKMGATKFRLYELPPGPQWGNRRRFLLISEEFPDWAVTTWPVQGKYQPFMMVARELSEAKSLAELAVVVCDMGSRGHHGQIAIGGTHDGRTIAGNRDGSSWTEAFSNPMAGAHSGGSTVWANMNAPSSYVYGTQGDAGPAARWIVDAQWPRGALPEC